MPSRFQRSAAPNGHKTSLRRSLFLQAFSLLLLATFTITIVAFVLGRRELTVRTLTELQGIAEGKATLFEDTISRERQQLSLLARDARLSSIRSITEIVGFRELITIDVSGTQTSLAQRNAALLPGNVKNTAIESDSTLFIPIFTEGEWTAYVIAAPKVERDVRTGTLLAIFDADALSAKILHSDSILKTSEVIVVAPEHDELTVIRSDAVTDRALLLYPQTGDEFLSQALKGEGGLKQGKDYSGIEVLSAARPLPSVGWAVVAKADSYEVTAPVLRLAGNLAVFGIGITFLLSLSMFLLARRIVAPLEELTKKLEALEARRFEFRRSIFTRNELETVDMAASDLTKRFREAHDHLEELVRERTEDLRKELASKAAILESMDIGLLVTDERGRITFINDLGASLTGWNVEAANGSAAAQVLKITDAEGKEIDRSAHPTDVAIATKTKWNPKADPKFSLIRKDGRSMPLHIGATPILRGQKVLGCIVVFQDMTEERRIDHMKTEFIALVSHQLRTPLSSIGWYAEMLLSKDAGPITDEQKQYLEEVSSSNARMVRLVNALLNVSKLELGKPDLNAEAMDCAKIAKSVGDSFNMQLQKKSMTLSSACNNMDGIELKTDTSLVELILENLVSNAVRYGTEGSVVSVLIEGTADKKLVKVNVANEGIGIPAEQMQYIGKKLFRGTNARLLDTDGNGLGLYISNLAAESLGGTLTFESMEGKSTTFTLTLPAKNSGK